MTFRGRVVVRRGELYVFASETDCGTDEGA